MNILSVLYKLRTLVNMWKSSQTDLDHLVSNFTVTLQNGQEKYGGKKLNALISRLWQILPEGKYLTFEI